MKFILFIFIFFQIFLSSCVKHIKPYTEKKRQYKLPVSPNPEDLKRSEGSLWSSAQTSNYLFTDLRANLLNDIVTIKIEEVASAQRGASTSLKESSEQKAGITAFLGVMKELVKNNPNLDAASLLDAVSSNKFDGGGTTSRTDKFVATVPGTVKNVMANGNLFIEGHRVVLVNEEEHHFYISGVARPIDISPDNSISSTLLADAQIEFTGRGIISDKNSPGWLSQVIDFVWPF